MSVHVNKKFKAYKSGIFNDPDCPKNSANHALLTVGKVSFGSLWSWWLIIIDYDDNDHDDAYDDFFDDHVDEHLSEGGSTAQSTRRQNGSSRTHGEKVGVR